MPEFKLNGKTYSGSTNYASAITYIKEDGSKTTVQKELDSRPVNNNLLINSNFANPVNQRGVVSPVVNSNADASFYTIDRWNMYGVGKLIINEGESITIEGGSVTLRQYIEDTELVDGKSVTLSAKVNGVIYTNTDILDKSGSGKAVIRVYDDAGKNICTIYSQYSNSKGYHSVAIGVPDASSVTVEWAKLELGEVATPYVPRLYAEELELCKRYYQSFANIIGVFAFAYSNSDILYRVNFTEMRNVPNATLLYVNGISSSNAGTNASSSTVTNINNDYAEINANFPTTMLINGNSSRIGLILDAEL